MQCWDLAELVLQIIYLGICLTSFIWRLTKDDKLSILFEFEMWAIMLLLIYYMLFLINAFKSIFNKSNEENKCLNFLKNSLFKYLWPFVMNSSIVFYLGYFCNWFYLNTEIGNDYILSLFLHGFSQFGFLIDIFLFNKKYQKTHFLDLIIITVIYLLYCLLLVFIKPEMNNYIFLSKESFNRKGNSFIISMMIMCYFIYLYMYFIYMHIVKFKSGLIELFGGKENNKEESKIEKLVNNEEIINNK